MRKNCTIGHVNHLVMKRVITIISDYIKIYLLEYSIVIFSVFFIFFFLNFIFYFFKFNFEGFVSCESIRALGAAALVRCRFHVRRGERETEERRVAGYIIHNIYIF